MTLKSPSGRLARWALQLQPYQLHIEYTPGKANVLADMLSRPQCSSEEPTPCTLCMISVDLRGSGAKETREEQLKDPETRKILDAFDTPNNEEEEAYRWTARGYMTNQGVLYHYDQEDDNEEPQLVIPAQDRAAVLHEYHDAPTAGYYGRENITSHRAPILLARNAETGYGCTILISLPLSQYWCTFAEPSPRSTQRG